jgi:hypothetical protein
MTSIDQSYEIGKQLAIREFEKQAFVGALANAGKVIWNSPVRKALGYLSGMGGRVGRQGSFAYKYLPSSTVGVGLGGGTLSALGAEDGNKVNAFVAGALGTGLGFGLFRNYQHLGKRLLTPWMRRANLKRYTNMGFSDDASNALMRKNELNFIGEQLQHRGGDARFLGKYLGSKQFNLLDQSQQNFIRQGYNASLKNKGYIDTNFTKGLTDMQSQAKSVAKGFLDDASLPKMTKFKYNLGTKGKFVGSLGGGLAISSAAHQPIENFSKSVANTFVPKSRAVSSNVYNPYYGGM